MHLYFGCPTIIITDSKAFGQLTLEILLLQILKNIPLSKVKGRLKLN